MDAVIYLRVSTKEQAAKDETSEGYSIPAQRDACLRYIGEKGWNVADEFVDAGESARTADRPMLKAMLRRIAEGDVGASVTWLGRVAVEAVRLVARGAVVPTVQTTRRPGGKSVDVRTISCSTLSKNEGNMGEVY